MARKANGNRKGNGNGSKAHGKRHGKQKRPLGAAFLTGGDKGSRTPDLLNAIETLYQLSYIPNKKEVARIISYRRAVVNGELSRSFRR